MGKYIEDLDLAKGFGILLVIMGHSLFPLHIAIDIFHMPLFFFIAGVTFNPNSRKKASDFIVKKVDRIFIPLCFFSILSGLLQIFIPKVGEGSFNGPLWFLQVILATLMVYIFIEYYLFDKVKTKNIVIIIGSLFAFFLARSNIKLFYDLDLVLIAVSFLHLGFLFKNIYNSLRRNGIILIILLSGILYCGGLYYSIKFGAEGAFLFRVYKYSYILFYLTSTSGILLVMSLSKLIKKIPVLNYLGKHSLIILCVHFPLIQRLNVFASSTTLYKEGALGKIIVGIVIYVITILFSVFCIEFCNRYIPKLKGYQSNFKI